MYYYLKPLKIGQNRSNNRHLVACSGLNSCSHGMGCKKPFCWKTQVSGLRSILLFVANQNYVFATQMHLMKRLGMGHGGRPFQQGSRMLKSRDPQMSVDIDCHQNIGVRPWQRPLLSHAFLVLLCSRYVMMTGKRWLLQMMVFVIGPLHKVYFRIIFHLELDSIGNSFYGIGHTRSINSFVFVVYWRHLGF